MDPSSELQAHGPTESAMTVIDQNPQPIMTSNTDWETTTVVPVPCAMCCFGYHGNCSKPYTGGCCCGPR